MPLCSVLYYGIHNWTLHRINTIMYQSKLVLVLFYLFPCYKLKKSKQGMDCKYRLRNEYRDKIRTQHMHVMSHWIRMPGLKIA